MTETANYEAISHKATRGLGWNYLSFGLGKLLNLITVSVLAHLLAPELFGVVAMATLAVDYLSIINDLGLGAAIIRQKDNVEAAANTAFTMNLVLGLSLSLISMVIAPWIATFFKEPLVTPILRWLGLTFFFSALGSVHNVRLQKELNFKQRLIADTGTSIIKAVVSIGLALAGFEIWALIFGQLTGVIAQVIILWIVYPWRPRLAFDRDIAKSLFNYGASVMGNNAFSIIEDNLDYVLVGRFYDSAALGIYTLAYRLPELLVINTLWLMTKVLFPTFSALQDQQEALKNGFLSVVRYVELLVAPICVGLFIAAEPIIRVLFGEQWSGSVPIMRILAIYALVVSIGFHVGDVYKAIGRPDILLKTSIPIFIIRATALWIGAQYGLVWVAMAHLIAGLFDLVLRLAIASHMLKITIGAFIRELRAFVACLALAGLAVPVLYLTRDTLPVIRLISIVAAGGLGYLAALWWLERETLNNALKVITKR